MKCILLLTLVAVCYSYPYGYGNDNGLRSGRNININEDGTIVITGASGKKIIINKSMGTSGQKTVDISVSGPNMPTKRIQINEQNKLSITGQGELGDSRESSDEYLRDKRSSKDSRKQRTQSETLTKILGAYKGDVDQSTYQQLLDEVNTAVQEGQLSPSVYNVLQNLDQVQGQVGQRGSWTRQNIIGQRQADVLELLREQAIEQELQQLQKEQQYKQLLRQRVRTPMYITSQRTPYQRSQIVLDVPVDVDQQREIMERALLLGQQGIRGLGVGGMNYITGTESRVGRTLWRPTVRDLLTARQSQYGQIRPIDQSISSQLSEVIQEEREILDQQRQVQQQQLQQEQEQQQLLVQQLVQQQQQDQQQRQQELLQQIQQQQLQEQEQLLEQQQKNNLRDLLNGGRTIIQTRGQQSLWQQQPGVLSQRGLYGDYSQGIQKIQRYNVPWVL